MADTNVIIAAAGASSRWGNDIKQLLLIDGETPICRTVRQLCHYFHVSNIILMANDDRCAVSPLTITKPSSDSIFPGTALGMSVQFWNDHNILLVLGDVYFSDSSITTLMRVTYFPEITFVGRLDRDPLTQHGGEIFAIWVPQNKQTTIKDAIEKASEARVSGLIDRHSGWEIYKLLNGFPINEHIPSHYGVNFIQQLDDTDDFDTMDDFKRWASVYNKKIDI